MTVLTNNTIQPSSGQALTIKDEGGTASITVATNGEATFAENIIIGTAGKGIDFSANTDDEIGAGSIGTTNGEVLDDYEHGSFTPVVALSTPGNSTNSNARGRYTKIGNQVIIQLSVEVNKGTGTGTVTCTGLPFTSYSGTYDRSTLALYVYGVGTSTEYPQVYISNNETAIRMSMMPLSNGASGNMHDTDLGSLAIFIMEGSYYTD